MQLAYEVVEAFLLECMPDGVGLKVKPGDGTSGDFSYYPYNIHLLDHPAWVSPLTIWVFNGVAFIIPDDELCMNPDGSGNLLRFPLADPGAADAVRGYLTDYIGNK